MLQDQEVHKVTANEEARNEKLHVQGMVADSELLLPLLTCWQFADALSH